MLSLHELNLSEKRKRGQEERGDNKRNNFNTISFFLFYKEKTVLNLCIYMYIQIYNIYFSLTSVSSTNKTDHHDTTKLLLKVALNTLTLTLDIREVYQYTELVYLW
jgi:hypothetical protein